MWDLIAKQRKLYLLEFVDLKYNKCHVIVMWSMLSKREFRNMSQNHIRVTGVFQLTP